MSTDAKMEAALARIEGKDVALDSNGAATPTTLDEQLKYCKWVVESRIVPAKSISEAFVVLQRGGELGFRGLASFDFLYVVNGRVRITPDGVKAKALGAGLLVDQREDLLGEGDNLEAVVTVQRKGIPTAFVGRFHVLDAKRAGLWGKDNWAKYPKRMLLARARGFAYGDAFRDLVGGLPVLDQQDLAPGERVGMEEPTPRATTPPPAGPDPLLADVTEAEVVPPSDPGPPFESHADADRALADDLAKSSARLRRRPRAVME
jgi:hypothetical protein